MVQSGVPGVWGAKNQGKLGQRDDGMNAIGTFEM